MANILFAPLAAAVAVSSGTPPVPLPAPLAAAPVLTEAGWSVDRREFTVLTYNVRGLPWPVAGGRKAALREIGRELGEMRRAGRAPDIVLIQEGFQDIDELVRLSGYRYAASGPGRRDRPGPDKLESARGFKRAKYPGLGEGWGKLAGSGLHVLTDFPVIAVETQPYRYCAGWDCLANKGAMMVRLAVPGLPNGLDVVNTHMNARGAAKAPPARTLKAHNLQMEELIRFVRRNRTEGAPLLVGGDFNVRHAPERYDYRAAERPFMVVAEYCHRGPAEACGGAAAPVVAKPWLESQDLQAFAACEGVEIRPLEARALFDGGAYGRRLSDHDGYEVRYELSWRRSRTVLSNAAAGVGFPVQQDQKTAHGRSG